LAADVDDIEEIAVVTNGHFYRQFVDWKNGLQVLML
jgi:hypothetical protein